MSTKWRYVCADGGVPALSRDVRRNLGKGTAALVADRKKAVVVTRAGQPFMQEFLREVAMAYFRRNQETGRTPDLHGFYRLFQSAGELDMLQVNGKMAAWALLRWDLGVCRVLAAQMAPGFGRYRPGRLLEVWLVARAVTDPGVHLLDWGDGYPETLLKMA